eukprot:gene11275-12455_t
MESASSSDTLSWQAESQGLLKNLLSILEGKQQVLDEREKQLDKETQNLKTRREELELEFKNKSKDMAMQMLEIKETYQSKTQHFEEEHRLMNNIYRFQSEKIKLDVGGSTFSTSVSTLCKYENSMLAVMFSGRHKLIKSEDGSYFIDRDGTYFRYILNFLRGRVNDSNDLPNDREILREIRSEADFYQLSSLVEFIGDILSTHLVGGNDFTQDDINNMLSTVVKTDKVSVDCGLNSRFLNNGLSELANAAFTSKSRSTTGCSTERDNKPAFIIQNMTKSKLDFTGKNLSGLSFSHATFNHDVLFRDCNLSNAKFYGCEFGVGVCIDFTHSDLRDCDFRNCKGKEAGPKMNFGPSTFDFGGGGLVSGASSDIFVRMIRDDKRIVFRGTRIDGAKFDPNVYSAVKASI